MTDKETIEQLKERIHTLEVYLEGAINYLILDGDVDNPIIGDVENILHISFNKRPNVPTSYQNLNKAKNILKRLFEEEKNNMYWEMNGADKSSYCEVRKEPQFGWTKQNSSTSVRLQKKT